MNLGFDEPGILVIIMWNGTEFICIIYICGSKKKPKGGSKDESTGGFIGSKWDIEQRLSNQPLEADFEVTNLGLCYL